MGSDESKVALITGCSSGIGRELARRFARGGFRVYASMRRPEMGEPLRQEAAQRGWRLSTPALDVTDEASVSAAFAALARETGGRLDVLVNNAGYYLFGPIEETSPDELRAQLETNVVGVLRVTRAALPLMRARRQGWVVNIGSISGRVVVPVAGPYHTSKYALEALTEALRYELAAFGVRVVLIEPGPYETELHAKETRARDSLRAESPYRPLMETYLAKAHSLPRGDLERLIDVIFRASTHPNPKLRWPLGPTSFSATVLRRFVPDRIFELAVRLAFRWGARQTGGDRSGGV